MNFGVLFAGQGSQKTGIGLDFMSDPLFKETIEMASEASGEEIEAIFKNDENQLAKTVYLQPALVAMEAGIYRMLMRDLPDIRIGGMVGLSLGEYGAMYASGALDLADTISLVSDRAAYMQEDADKIDNAMAALIKPDVEKIESILQKMQDDGQRIYLANYNSPKQVVIAGVKDDVLAATEEIKDQAAAKRAIMLKINGAFHTPLFNSAREKMHERLASVEFSESKIPVISNTTVKPFTNDWAEIMEKQLAVPTHFGDCLSYLIKNMKIDATLEIGPGKTLTSFANQVDSNLENWRIGSLQEYQEFIEAKNGLKG